MTNSAQKLMEIPIEVRGFIEALMQEAHVLGVTAEMQEEMVQQIYTDLDRYIAAKIIDNLPIESLDTFMELDEKKISSQELETFLKTNLPNATEVYKDAFSEFKQSYMQGVMQHTDKTHASQ